MQEILNGGLNFTEEQIDISCKRGASVEIATEMCSPPQAAVLWIPHANPGSGTCASIGGSANGEQSARPSFVTSAAAFLTRVVWCGSDSRGDSGGGAKRPLQMETLPLPDAAAANLGGPRAGSKPPLAAWRGWGGMGGKRGDCGSGWQARGPAGTARPGGPGGNLVLLAPCRVRRKLGAAAARGLSRNGGQRGATGSGLAGL